MKKLGVVLAGWVAMSTLPASAADLALKAAPVVAPAWSWTGFYIGVVSGITRGEHEWRYFNNAPPFGGPGNDQMNWGTQLGGTVGYNWQAASWVFGVEADWSWSDVGTQVTCANIGVLGVAGTLDCRSNLRDFGTARGRLGYSVRNFMFYLTGGAAWGGLTKTELLHGTDVKVFEQSKTHFGYTAGFGLEWAPWGNWSTKFEWLYYDLGRESYDNAAFVGGPDRIRPSGHIFRTGINYHFNFAGPVRASY